jgi:hypothetical protein
MLKKLTFCVLGLIAMSALVVVVVHTPPIPAVATASAIEQPLQCAASGIGNRLSTDMGNRC